jgi:phosphohistidine phosphatase
VRTLYLLRHGKSSWDDPELDDFDRPLAPRGRKAAARIAAHMEEEGIAPELVICSPAQRARATLDGLGDAVAGARVDLDRDVYDAHETDLLARLREVPPEVGTVLLIGHNPSIERLALLLAAESARLDELRAKYPTAALATLTFRAPGWRELGPGGAELAAFVRPRDLG